MACEMRGLRADAVSYSFGRRQVLRGVSLHLPPGGRVALTGPNGSGKTTLLRVISGAAQPSTGAVALDGVPLRTLRPRMLAQRIAVVAQHVQPTLTFTVRQLVAMGRTPYIGLFSGASSADAEAVERALHETESLPLADRPFNELSGGEQQRVMLAVGLAQETDYLLLDEPTVHLDLHHQHDLLRLLVELNRRRSVGIVAVLHDLNLAALYFDRIAVLAAGRLAADGPPREVMSEEVLGPVFHAPLRVIQHPTRELPQVLLDPPPTPVPEQ